MLSPAVLHRDVKSANIMLTEDEEGVMVAKLSDFGLHVVSVVLGGGVQQLRTATTPHADGRCCV
jgi:serine/threonine protein kinase